MTNRNKTLDYARNALNSGNAGKARRALVKVGNYQNDRDVLYLVAVSFAIDKKFSKAEKLFKATLKLSGPNDALLGNLGLAQLDQGKFREAIESYLAAIDINPGFYDALVNLASSYDYLNMMDKAVVYAQRAQKLHRNNPIVLNVLGKHAALSNKLSEAIALYRSSLSIQPNMPQTYALLSEAYLQAKNYKPAEDTLKQGLISLPHNSILENSLASLYASRRRFEDAIEVFKRMLAKDKHDTFTLAAMAETLVGLQEFDQARDILLSAYEKFPGDAEIAAALSNYYELHKAHDSAYQVTSSFIENLPVGADVPDSIAIAHGKSCQRNDKLAEAQAILKKAIDRDRSTHMARESLHYAYADTLDGLKEFDDAFVNYKLANEVLPRHSDIEYHESVMTDLVDTLDRSFLDSVAVSDKTTALPVFIVGMPRSGTSLVEQIISSHPDAYGAGELTYIWDISDSLCGAENMFNYTKNLNQLSPERLNEHAENYLNKVVNLSGGEMRVTDKMPHNFLHLGLIGRLFPNATVIHCQRHPFDTCLSIYFTKFNESHRYAGKLEDLARFYKKYTALMAHWHNVSSLKIIDVKYKDMIADQKAESAKLIEHIGLEWSDSVLDFHKSKRVIMTPSFHQASKPIYTSSMYRWKNYRDYVAPLMEVLGEPEQYD
jgi:pentatricopeptide repeat protein